MVQTSFLSREHLNHAEETLIRTVEPLRGMLRIVISADRVCREMVRAVIPYLRITGRAEVRRCG